ncbi:hypothetical protein F2P56_030807 [Juglans regia]|uniref:Endonuclease/exonuclease/phosphatase domain-containing protein n=1 Tax=Juglans regia TaxID=51240 RepID=A0A833U4A8_JUGRE|nr:hypothetical protein F2P56_030807 [Juglans regia]
MKTLVWNCRGLGNPWTVQDLSLLVKDKRPEVIFLMETMIKTRRVEGLKSKLRMEGCFVVDSLGRRGGLALFWDGQVSVEILNFSQWHINASVKEGNTTEWNFTGFYGHPEVAKRKFTWELLNRLKPSEGRAWCVAADFNEVLTQSEKKKVR